MKQNKNFEQLPVDQQMQITRNVMTYLARPVMVILRPDVGCRLLTPKALGCTTVVEILASTILSNRTISPLSIFAVITFGLGVFRHFSAKRQARRGLRQHTFYMGTSRLRFSFLPEFVQRDRLVERYWDPICCFAVGTFLLPVSPLFGFWICLSAACLRLFESDVHVRAESQTMDLTDGLIASEIHSEVVENFEGNPTAVQSPSSEVSTGVDRDICERINRRKEK